MRYCVVTTAAIIVTLIGTVAIAQHGGDIDADGIVDLGDVAAFEACAGGPGVLPEPGCWVFDFDRDVDVDFADYAAMQRAFAVPPSGYERVAGIWHGTGETPDGQEFPFRLTLAQWGHRIWGLGELTVNPGDPLNGRPAFHLAGSIHGGRMVLSMSAELTNLCFVHSPDAYIATIDLDNVTGALTLTDVAAYLPAACDQVVRGFSATRTDSPHQPGNADILGTWEGHMVTPAGWFYSPIPFWHHRKSFQMLGPAVAGWMQVSSGGPWGTMSLEWDVLSQLAVYRWVCESRFTYKGVIDGNKFSGVFKWRFSSPGEETPDEMFDGVFVYTLREVFVPPEPIVPGC